MRIFVSAANISILAGACLLLGCPTDPPPPEDGPTDCFYPPGNRNFTWRLDTVAWWPSSLGGVWAFSDTDAWVMGDMHGSAINGQNTSYVGLRWNGTTWSDTVEFLDVLVKPNDVIGDDQFMASVGYRLYGDTGGAISKAAITEFDNRTKKWKGYQFETRGELRSVWTDGKGYFMAVGDSGMVYIKDGYSTEWVYSKAPTDFNFYRLTGVSKTEIYILGRTYVSGTSHPQLWKYDGSFWVKLRDDFDTAGTVLKFPEADNSMGDMAVQRCSITDSLQLFVIGWESYLVEATGQSLDFTITNLSSLGLPLRAQERTGLDINLYSQSDYWVFGTRYNFYHWNGNDFQKMTIPGLPNDDIQFGGQRRMVKTGSGKIFLPTEVSSQVYVVVQGTP